MCPIRSLQDATDFVFGGGDENDDDDEEGDDDKEDDDDDEVCIDDVDCKDGRLHHSEVTVIVRTRMTMTTRFVEMPWSVRDGRLHH